MKKKCNLRLFPLVLVLLFSDSCVSTKRYTSFTKEKVWELQKTSQVTQKLDYLEIRTDSLIVQDSLIKVQKLKSFFIPAIFYWQSEHSLKCELSPKVPVRFFEQEFMRLADSADLKSKLNGQKIELSILQIPNSFVYTHKEKTIIFIVAYIVSSLEAIYPDNKELKIRYRIVENDENKKTGIITIPNTELPIKNVWKSSKKFTWVYLDKYKKINEKTAKDVFENLIILF